MGYLGNSNVVQNFTPAVDYFNGNGSTTSFTLSRTVGSVFDIQAFIENVPQNPSSAFTVAGNVITFTSAPPSGTNNIYVRYTSPVTQLVKPAPGTVGPTELNSAYSLWNLSGATINYTAGSVGIGTSPSFPLDISAASGTTARIKSTGNYSYLRLDNTSATGGGAVMCFQNGVQKAVFGVTGAILGDTSSDAGVYAEAGQGVRFYSNGTERMRITSAGDVGIGTSSPSQRLQVGDGTADTRSTFRPNNAFAIGVANGAGFAGWIGGSGVTDTMVFSSSGGAERMRIDSSGTLFIGGTSSPSGTQRLVLTANGGAGIEPMLFNELRSTSATENYVLFYRNGSQVGAITNTLSATAYVTSSDYRLKKDIAPMIGALDKIVLLKPVTYKWKLDDSDGQGFIAHELAEVCPDAVSGVKDAVDEEGNIKPQGIDTSFLVATLTAAIQEQQAIIEDLKTRIEILEDK